VLLVLVLLSLLLTPAACRYMLYWRRNWDADRYAKPLTKQVGHLNEYTGEMVRMLLLVLVLLLLLVLTILWQDPGYLVGHELNGMDLQGKAYFTDEQRSALDALEKERDHQVHKDPRYEFLAFLK